MPNSGYASTQQRILDAATELFSTSGYNGVSTREVARLAEVNETSIYRYYQGKRELFIATLDTELSKVHLEDRHVSKLIKASDASAAKLALFRVIIEAVLERRALVRLMQFSVLEYRDDLDETYRRHVQRVLSIASEYLSRWPELDEAQDSDNRVTIFAFIAAFIALKDFYPMLAGDHLTTDSLEEAASSCANLWHAALAKKPGQPVPLLCSNPA